jgi:hypothetical protein
MFEKSLLDYLNDGYVQGLNKSVFSPPKHPVGGEGGGATASPGPQIPKPPPDSNMGDATIPGTPMQNPGEAQGISGLLAPAGQVAGQWGGRAMADYLKSPGPLSPEMMGLMGNLAGGDTQSNMMGAIGKEMMGKAAPAIGIPELGGFQKYMENPMLNTAAPGGFDIMKSAPDPMSLGMQAPGVIMDMAGIGSPQLRKGVTAAGATAAAVAQGGLNPVSDVMALKSIYDLLTGWL